MTFACIAAARRFDPAHPYPLGDSDYWYRTTLHGAGPRIVRLNGLATIAEVWLDDTLLLCSDNMYVAHDLPVTLGGAHRLALCFRSLDRHLSEHPPRGPPRGRPRPDTRHRPRPTTHTLYGTTNHVSQRVQQ